MRWKNLHELNLYKIISSCLFLNLNTAIVVAKNIHKYEENMKI
jgi:hypothetical protein